MVGATSPSQTSPHVPALVEASGSLDSSDFLALWRWNPKQPRKNSWIFENSYDFILKIVKVFLVKNFTKKSLNNCDKSYQLTVSS